MSLAIIRRAVQTPTLNAARSIRCNPFAGFSTTLRYYSSKHVRGSFRETLPNAFARSNVGGTSNVTLNRHTILNPFLFMQARNYADKTVTVPPMAESISEGTLKRWTKQVGDFIHADEEIATIETDKVDVTVNSPVSGTIIELYAEVDSTVTVGANLFKVELGDAPKEGAAAPSASAEASPAQEEKPETPDVSKKKAESAPPEPKSAPSPPPSYEPLRSPPPPPPQSSSPPSPPSRPESPPASPTRSVLPLLAATGSPYGPREERRVKMNRMRLRIAERLKESQNSAASLTTFNEIDMSNIMELRNTYKELILKKHGIKLGFMSAFVKAAVYALQEVAVVNASIEGPDGGDTIVYKDYVDMSVAVATPKGLVTPVVRNAHLMSFIEIEKAIAELGQKARDGKITIEDMAGGTFTISNGGVFGSLMGTPIINIPQSAILGMHITKERPVAINGKVEIRPMMYVALTYDHRLIDGREAVTFLKTVKEQVEDPRRLLLDV
ncbi:6087_t:CDS:10 [Paraglomus brasilianum]|uniref:dihydrolipoyllysine-residue succinyltransferase n=1 Tax=Paraglomus brasilianum TaxID=144538 RepID=A0A9N8VLV3_9GLOM|nr:6087_t:CDS:10 [Paraglomus brasilianum]